MLIESLQQRIHCEDYIWQFSGPEEWGEVNNDQCCRWCCRLTTVPVTCELLGPATWTNCWTFCSLAKRTSLPPTLYVSSAVCHDDNEKPSESTTSCQDFATSAVMLINVIMCVNAAVRILYLFRIHGSTLPPKSDWLLLVPCLITS